MLVNSNDMLKKAKSCNSFVFHFNINNLEWTRIILESCESEGIPVILGVSLGAVKYMGGFDVVFSMVNSLVNDLGISIPVCLHLDHGDSFDSCKKAIDAGFTSVMIDASKYDYNENVRITKMVSDYAHKYNVSVEAEIGHVGGIEDDVTNNVLVADYNDCLRFVKDTNIDSLAPAIGTVHGIYKGELNIDFDLIRRLSYIDIPLVMHGGSGVDEKLVIKAINCGINKINFNSDLQYVWYNDVKKFINSNDVYDPRKVIMSGSDAIKKFIHEKVDTLKAFK